MSKINLNRKPQGDEFHVSGDPTSIKYIAGLLDEVGIFDEHFNYLDDGTVEIILPRNSHNLAIKKSVEYRDIFTKQAQFSTIEEA